MKIKMEDVDERKNRRNIFLHSSALPFLHSIFVCEVDDRAQRAPAVMKPAVKIKRFLSRLSRIFFSLTSPALFCIFMM
jgi:hypothetical protein